MHFAAETAPAFQRPLRISLASSRAAEQQSERQSSVKAASSFDISDLRVSLSIKVSIS